jgi:hypothetical protein
MKNKKKETLSYFFTKELKNGLTVTTPISDKSVVLNCITEELNKLKEGETISAKATSNLYLGEQ